MFGYYRKPIGPDNKYEYKVVRGLDKITTDATAIVSPLAGIFGIVIALSLDLKMGFCDRFFVTLIGCICAGLALGIIAFRNDRPVWGTIGIILNIASIVILSSKFWR